MCISTYVRFICRPLYFKLKLPTVAVFLLHAYIYINSKKEPTLSDYEINNSYIIQIYIECLGVGT